LGTFEHDQIKREAAKLGFYTASAALPAADYGVPQRRKRAIIIGCRSNDPSAVFPPSRTHYDPAKGPLEKSLLAQAQHLEDAQEWRSVRDAVADLERPVGTEIRDRPPPLDLHFGRNPTELSRKRYRAIPKEGQNRFDLQEKAPELTPDCWIRKTSGGTDLFGRLWWDRPAFTIRTEFFKPEKGRYLHPKQHRPITHREAARFQGFPDKFVFRGSKLEIAKQIGNAVPPPLAARLADSVVSLLLIQGKT
jgi:DNA (cytosine-5)-methyltransferase 1